MQAFTCCFAMDYLRGEDHTIDKPRDYAFWRDYVPSSNHPGLGALLILVNTAIPSRSKPTQRRMTDPRERHRAVALPAHRRYGASSSRALIRATSRS